MLQQKDDQGIDQSISFCSSKFDEAKRKYFTLQKQSLALLIALKHFDVYLDATAEPVLVYSYYNQIVFTNKTKEKNQ